MDKRQALAVFFIEGERAEIELRRYDDSRLSLTGIFDGSSGQNLDTIHEEAGTESEDLNAVVAIWKAHHLNETPDSVFDACREALERLNGQRLGSTPDVDDAPDIGGDVFDSRDVMKRAEIYREAVRFMGVPEDELDSFDMGENFPAVLEGIDADSLEIVEEFVKVRDFNEEGEGYGGDWRYGCSIIADDYFQEYAEQFAEDVGLVNADAQWPNNRIDWEAAAEDLKQDYSAIEYDGKTYWVR